MFSKSSPYQRFISDFYGPLSKSSLKARSNKRWINKNKEDTFKQSFRLTKGNKVTIKGKDLKLKNNTLINILNIPKNNYVAWGNNKKSYKIK